MARAAGAGMLLVMIAASACTSDDSLTSPETTPRASLATAAGPVVTTANDAGAGSLRQAVLDGVAGEIITFDASVAGKTIVLSTGAIAIDKALTIEGPATSGVRISGGLLSRVFDVAPNGVVVFRNVSIVDGVADEGGGIRNAGKVLIDHSLIANNTATSTSSGGGGIYSTGMGSELIVVNSTISGNAAYIGPALWAEGAALRNSTIAGNIGTLTSGVKIRLQPLLARNTIIADNLNPKGNQVNCDIESSVAWSGLNMVGDSQTCSGTGTIAYDGSLGPIGNHGGPTLTYSLKPGSKAIDAGLQCTESTDQRYVDRVWGTSCDLGAYEFDDFARLSLTAGPNGTVDKAGKAAVSGTISCSVPGMVTLDVSLSQTIKTTGRFTTIVQASGQTTVSCSGTSSWSLPLTPATGKFESGNATATVKTSTIPIGFLPATTTGTIKLFLVK
jgi:hypothetical protein